MARHFAPRADDQKSPVRHPAGCRRGRAHFPDRESPKGILMTAQLHLGEISVDLVFKDIKNVHLSVHPPTGRVRISAPERMKIDTIRVFAISKLGWIKRQQITLRGQERET